MPISPIATNNFNSQPLSAAESRSVQLRVNDTLAQAGSSSDGFIMSILKPIGRFFVNIVSYFKYICCCCPAKEFKGPDFPKVSAEQMKAYLGHEGYEVVKKSDTLFTVKIGRTEFTVEIVPYKESFAMQIEEEDNLWKKALPYTVFVGSSAVILKGLKDSNDIQTAKYNGFVKEGTVWVKKGPVEGVLCLVLTENKYEFFFGAEAPIHLTNEKQDNKWVITGLDKCPKHLPALIQWADATLNEHDERLIVKDPSSDFAKELEKHGFVKRGTTYTYAIPVRDDSDE